MILTSINTMNIKQILVFVIISLSSSISLATSIVERSSDAQSTINLKSLKGTFSQIKNIKPLRRPFKSSGSFVYLPNKGLLWHTQNPVDSIKLFTNDGVYQLNKQGLMQKEAQLDNDFFLALFAGDEQKLAKFFNAKELGDKTNEQATCLALAPISNTMQSLFKTINLCVTEVNSATKIPTKIELIEAKGNHTKILLQLSSDKVSPEELAYFE